MVQSVHHILTVKIVISGESLVDPIKGEAGEPGLPGLPGQSGRDGPKGNIGPAGNDKLLYHLTNCIYHSILALN